MVIEISKTQNDQIKISQGLPNFNLAAPYKIHSIKMLDLPKPVFTVIINFENSRGRLLLWKLWRFQYVKIPISIWLHWKVRCSAICWCFDSSILMNIQKWELSKVEKTGFVNPAKYIFLCPTLGAIWHFSIEGRNFFQRYVIAKYLLFHEKFEFLL